MIEQEHGIPIENQQLFHHGRLLKKDKRRLSKYRVDEQSTSERPLLLLQKFKAKVVCSNKVMRLYSLTMDHHIHKLHPKQQISCVSTTTIASVLEQLNLSHLSHLVKICVGTGKQEVQSITQMDMKLIDIPHLLDDGMPTLSVLFSARWFADRGEDIGNLHHLMSDTIEQSVNAARTLKNCTTFARLGYQFEKTQSFILGKFENLNSLIQEQSADIGKAWKWFDDVMEDNLCPPVQQIELYLNDEATERKVDDQCIDLLHQLRGKAESLGASLKQVEDKWIRKRRQIVLYLQKTVRNIETELMAAHKNWISSDIVQWLNYMDDRIIFEEDTLKQMLYLNGYNLGDVNDLSLKLMGIDDEEIRTLVLGYIDALLRKYGDKSGCTSCDSPHSPDCDHNHGDKEEKNMCCICTLQEVNTVIAPCGHAVYCAGCGDRSKQYGNRCPVCRQQISSIITVYKAGLQFS